MTSLITSSTFIPKSSSPWRFELEGHLIFLDTDIYRRPDGSLEHIPYRKPTHSNLYLNAESHYHLANMHSVYTKLEPYVTNKVSLPWELEFLCSTFNQNDYTDRQVHHVLYPPYREESGIRDTLTLCWTRLEPHEQGATES
jgi:hypothetical protein